MNSQKVLRGWDNPSLEPDGVKEAQSAAQHIADNYPVHHIYSSPLDRSRQTSEQLSQATGAKVTHTDGLLPWNYGKFTGKPENSKTLKSLQFFQDHKQIPTPDGESYQSFLSRYGNAIAKMAQLVHQQPDKAVVVSTHSRNLYPLEHLLSGGKKDIAMTGGFPPGIVVKVEFNGKGGYTMTKEKHSGGKNVKSVSSKLVR